MEKQTTIRKSVSFEGIGLHTGNLSTITFNPAEADYGYKFIRKDLPEIIEIEAVTDNVIDLSRGTTIGKNESIVHTIEHVLASLVGLGIDNCKIELTANEPPVGDGSAMPFVTVLLEAGIKELEAEKEYFYISETIRYTNEDKGNDLVALPLEDYRVTVMVDYANPALGSQHTGLFNLKKEFVNEFAPARTFCFLHEVLKLRKDGLIKGGSLENALVILDRDLEEGEMSEIIDAFKLLEEPALGDNGILDNRELRFKNEPARHKLLDVIGDLALVGVSIKAQILAARPGHRSNYEFAKLIREQYLEKKKNDKYLVNKQKAKLFDIQQIMEILPHRYPFLLVDRITEYDDSTKTIIGYKNVSINEPYFNGHFPGKPIMPGVLILEAMAQTGGILIFQTQGDAVKNKIAFFATINNAKFRRPVLPGDQLVFEVRLASKKFNIFQFDAKAYVLGKLVAEAELQASLVDK
jgi:UDP-3-O-[3-hydroxymyristoyl] N-acetylglucosamine deacetylase/3-hydroxyacyl-[acyl-carrier-protein] dehydratase